MGDNEIYEFLQKEKDRTFALTVYGFLCMMVRQETQTCYPARSTIAEKTGMCVSMVDVGLEVLATHHIVIIAKRKGKHHIYLMPDKSHWKTLPSKPINATWDTYLWDTQVPIDSVLTNNKYSKLYKSAIKKEVAEFSYNKMKV